MGTKETLSPSIKRALVTGGGGFVGKAVVKRLLQLGVETRVLGRHLYPEVEQLGASCFVGNICNRTLVEKASCGVDIVFHVAALAGIWGKWQEYLSTNVQGTEVVVASCLKNKVPMLVYTSTPSVVFNREDIEGEDETLTYAASTLCHYAESKIMAEKCVLGASGSDLLTCALRPHLIWGPGDPHLLPRLVASGRRNMLKRVGDGANLVDITYIDNVAHAQILAATNLANQGSAAGRAYFISQGEPVNLWGWINQLFAELGIDEVKQGVSFKAAYRVGAILETVHRLLPPGKEPRMTRFLAEQLAKSHYFSIENARKDLGYEPVVSTAEGLRKTVQWLRSL